MHNPFSFYTSTAAYLFETGPQLRTIPAQRNSRNKNNNMNLEENVNEKNIVVKAARKYDKKMHKKNIEVLCEHFNSGKK